MGAVVIPKSYMGRVLDEAVIRRGLTELNPGFHFDMGAALGIWHPYQDKRQGVFFEGRHIASLDRGSVPENPIWSVVYEQTRIPTHLLRLGDLDALYETTTVNGVETVTGWASVRRPQRDRIILVGWRHTFIKIVSAKIHGADKPDIERKFGVDLGWRGDVKVGEVPDEHVAKVLDQSLSVGVY